MKYVEQSKAEDLDDKGRAGEIRVGWTKDGGHVLEKEPHRLEPQPGPQPAVTLHIPYPCPRTQKCIWAQHGPRPAAAAGPVRGPLGT